jgi:hypothetical protein
VRLKKQKWGAVLGGIGISEIVFGEKLFAQ